MRWSVILITPIGGVVRYLRSLLNIILIVTVIASLSACGGGSSGDGDNSGDEGNLSDEVSFELGQDGLGDLENYFPLNMSNFWQYQGTETSSSGIRYYQNTTDINRTKLIDGVTTLVLNESASLGEVKWTP
jgi:hypothetical protein